MSTNVTRSQPGNGSAPAPAAVAKDAGVSRNTSDPPESPSRKISGYGLPCSKCRLYYPADLDECPTCHHKERASPVTPKFPARAVQPAAGPIPDSATLEQEEILRQCKSRRLGAPAEVTNVSESVCQFTEHHPGEPGKADVCTGCHERLKERFEACARALHMDLQEAAQILYNAVWADPSDPGKTYQNAASALLTELRKRAGITAGLGPFPL